ncbi:MAG: hypothetical protein JSU63_03610 [Phycisphaerales bacterium]|nr:MAG: hypothetical protein JSU63_03610 [Phycisphaerales bacterium]
MKVVRPFLKVGDSNRKRAVVAVQVGVMLVTLLAFAALSIDVGAMYNARGDLQRAADVAALAGATSYVEDTMLQVRLNPDGGEISEVLSATITRVNELAAENASFGVDTTLIEGGDITTGWIDVTSGTSPIQVAGSSDAYNAVQVVAKRTAEGLNGSIALYFAPIFGITLSETEVTATAVFDDHVAGFSPGEDPGILMPFSIHEDLFDSEITVGSDEYSYDSDDDEIESDPDGLPEIKLFPWTSTPGNFGLLNIGLPSMGAPGLADHIENGVPPEDLEAEIGTDVLTFYDWEGDPVTYDIGGDPGMTVSLTAAIETRVGDVVAFLLHNAVNYPGANAVYTVTDVRFGRVMKIKLTGSPTSKTFLIQPVSYAGPGVVVDPNAPSSNGLAGRLKLAR